MADLVAEFPTPLSATHLYSPRSKRSAAEINRVCPKASVAPSFTRTHDSLTAGFPVALQNMVTFILSVSITVRFCGPWLISGDTLIQEKQFFLEPRKN